MGGGRKRGARDAGGHAVGPFLSALGVRPRCIAEAEGSLRDAGVPEDEWLRELRGMEDDGSLHTFLRSVGKSLAPKLLRREQELVAELSLVQQELCTLHAITLPSQCQHDASTHAVSAAQRSAARAFTAWAHVYVPVQTKIR